MPSGEGLAKSCTGQCGVSRDECIGGSRGAGLSVRLVTEDLRGSVLSVRAGDGGL